MYVSPNFKSKAAFKRALKEGRIITVFNPGPFGDPPDNGTCFVEGPHYPKPHSWYGQVTVKEGKVISIK